MSPPTMEKVLIDLSKFADEPTTRVYAGRGWGRAVRKQARLDEYDRDPDVTIEVYVPEDVWRVSSSFFLALFGESIRHLKEEGFRRKYRFTGRDIRSTVEDGIVDATSGPTGLF